MPEVVEPGSWIQAAGKLKGTSEEVRKFNAHLDALQSKLYDAHKALIRENKPITAESLKNKYTGASDRQRMLVPIFQKHNDEVAALVPKEFSAGTLERYKTSLSHTIEFMKWKFKVSDMDIRDINHEFITDYDFFLRSVRSCATSLEQRISEIITKKSYSREFLTSFFSDNKDYFVRTSHKKFNKDQKAIEKVFFDMLENESVGTQKYFGLLGPILLSLTQKRILWIDEIDSRLHPILLENIISLFNSKKYNPNGAQIVFSSHNTIPLKKLLRRDQMVFVEKDAFGVSSIQSLYTKAPKVRSDASFDKDYLLGKYGGIPRLNVQLNLDFPASDANDPL